MHVTKEDKPFLEVVAEALGLQLRIVTTSGEELEAEHEQWEDGNNVVALEPGDDRALVSCWVSRPLWPSAHAKE
jgi:arginine deiminase